MLLHISDLSFIALQGTSTPGACSLLYVLNIISDVSAVNLSKAGDPRRIMTQIISSTLMPRGVKKILIN